MQLKNAAFWNVMPSHCCENQRFGTTFILHHQGEENHSRMVSYGMLRRVAFVRTDVSEEFTASFTRVTRICEIGTTLAVTSVFPSSPILVALKKDVGSYKSHTA
jgi:hypothetical protein